VTIRDGDPSATRRRLAAAREDALGRIAALSREFDDIVAASASHLSGTATDDEHDPEGATIAFERAQVAALLDAARDRLVALDRALDRLQGGGYGTCERCGRPIGTERLAARPAATTCVACATGTRR